MAKKKILVIDDDYNFAKEDKEELIKAGYDVVIAYSGKEGLEKLAAEKPDCILLDLVLPDESGFRIAQQIKALPEFNATPIIVTSLKREAVDKHIAAKSGITVYMEKPINYARLLYYIKDFLGE